MAKRGRDGTQRIRGETKLTILQKLQVRQSEVREKINELLGVDIATRSTVQDNELTALTDEAQRIEPSIRAALVVEDADRAVAEREAAELGDLGAPETREVAELRSKSSVCSYVKAALEMRALDGPEAELNSALSMGSHQFPLEMLAPEERQTTAVDVSVNQGNWLDRLFNGTAAQYLGVTFQSVGPGVASVPVTTAGATAAQLDKSGAAAAAAWVVGITELRPKRNAVNAIFSIEDVARIGPGLEAALQRDLRSAMIEGVDRVIFKGDLTPTAAGADIVGFQTAAISEFTLTQANKIKGTNVLAALAAYIDGKHATSPENIKVVASVGSNVLWLNHIPKCR